MKIPERMSRTRVCAPSPTATPTIPAEAMTGPKLKPNSPKTIAVATIQTTALRIEVRTEPIVRARSA